MKEIQNHKADFDMAFNREKPDVPVAWETRKKIEEITKRFNLMEVGRSFEAARRIFGKEFFGFDEVVEAIGITPPDDYEVSPIHFTFRELKKAAANNMRLILRMSDHNPGPGKTGYKRQYALMHNYITMLFTEKDKKRKKPLLGTRGQDGRIHDEFGELGKYEQNSPTDEWILVVKDPLPVTLHKNYYEQTQVIVDYLKDYYKDQEMPREYVLAIEEFAQYEHENFEGKTKEWVDHELRNGNPQKYAYEMTKLQISELFRQSTSEAIYDLAAVWGTTGKRPYLYVWTNTPTYPYGVETPLGPVSNPHIVVVNSDDSGISFSETVPAENDYVQMVYLTLRKPQEKEAK